MTAKHEFPAQNRRVHLTGFRPATITLARTPGPGLKSSRDRHRPASPMIAEAIGSAASTPSIVALEPSRAHRRTTHSGQITMGPAPPTHPFPRFPPLEVFESRPSAPSSPHHASSAGIRKPSQSGNALTGLVEIVVPRQARGSRLAIAIWACFRVVCHLQVRDRMRESRRL